MSSNVQLDPYTAEAQNDNVTLLQKVTDLHKVIQGAQTGMLTTRASDDHLHARAMTPVGPYSSTQVSLTFIANKTSPKFQDIKNDAHVNVSFFDTSSTSWASFSGIAKVCEDRSVVRERWNQNMAAYFGDLGDGIHKGDENDPRVVVIEVIPDEVCYWLATGGAISRRVQEVVTVVRGKTCIPGELRKITKEEIQLAQGLGSQTA
ncbi:hypothetical protein B0F90DRAFT_1808866 [Multifurca ochricompacta]|uniref:General stress protein FMN-binding split barrel domain-containing protein n=1 Tax=Multifurca ochricompacta TaxID=376703 RepID=A0AAD4QQZ8_9AGAM|nr:hypothetical protein B0F90DRAFT_1808866 [Multifurca ochricompacta]